MRGGFGRDWKKEGIVWMNERNMMKKKLVVEGDGWNRRDGRMGIDAG